MAQTKIPEGWTARMLREIEQHQVGRLRQAASLRVADWDGSAFFAETEEDRAVAVERMSEAERVLRALRTGDVVYVTNEPRRHPTVDVSIPEAAAIAERLADVPEEDRQAWLEDRVAEIKRDVDRFLLPPKAEPVSEHGISTARFKFLGKPE